MQASLVKTGAVTRRQAPERRLRLHATERAVAAAREAFRKRPAAAEAPPSEPQSTPDGAERSVLVAGRDADRRAGALDQLARSLPQSTRFEEAAALWEVLARAPESRLVVISDELDGIPPESLRHTLGHRHPDLPVVSFGAPQLPGR